MSAAMRFTMGHLLDLHGANVALDRLKVGIAEFMAGHAERTGVVDFLDVPTGDAFDVSPERAISYFRAKGLRPTFHYADMLGEAHDHAFTVAKMMDVDMLAQVRASLDDALANGTSFGEWKKGIEPILRAGGWWGQKEMIDPLTGQTVTAQLGSPWRLETIFRTNMQTAYAAGQWAEIESQAEIAQFLMYDAIDDLRTRPLHKAWDQTVLPWNHKWWETHYAPLGFNCRCGVIQLSQDELAGMGLSVSGEPPADGTYKWRNPRTDVVENVPLGVDPGFDHNSGKYLLTDMRNLLDEKIAVLPADMQPAAIKGARREFDDKTMAGRWHAAAFDDAPDWLREVVLESPDVVVESGANGAHAIRDRIVNMGSHKIDGGPLSASVWRHEFGHIMDARKANGLYASSDGAFPPAMHFDSVELQRAAGIGRASKAMDKQKAERAAAYAKANAAMVEAGADGREAELRKMADDAGIDLDSFTDILKRSTLLLSGESKITDFGVAARVARMLAAIKRGDAQEFLIAASFKDDKELWKLSGKIWRIDGALSALSDLVGATTRNNVASYSDGFPGHSDVYYRRAPYSAGTEVFANLTALAGHPLGYWWEITKRFVPNVSAEFEKIFKGE